MLKGKIMKPHHYLAIFVRLFAIALFIFAIQQSSYLFQLIIFGQIQLYQAPIFQIFLSLFIPIFISLVLWFFPVITAKSILKPEIDQDIEATSKLSIFFVIVSAIGLYVTFYALVDATYYFTLWQISNSPDSYGNYHDLFTPDIKDNIWATVVELAVGLILIFKGKTIAKKIFEISS